MRPRRRLLAARRTLRCEAAFAALALLFSGCYGDFGRPRPTIFSIDRPGWVADQAAAATGLPPSIYPWTDDERLLRELAYALIAPPYTLERWYYLIADFRRTGLVPYYQDVFDYMAYGGTLLGLPYRSATSLYERLIDDARNDGVLIDQFAPVAFRVLDYDRKRQKSLAFVSGLTPDEAGNAAARVAENAMILAWVQKCAGNRAAAYRYALQRLVIAAPESHAVEAERTVNGLDARIAKMYAGYVVAPVEASLGR